MTHEAAGVPTTRNDDALQDDAPQDERPGPPAGAQAEAQTEGQADGPGAVRDAGAPGDGGGAGDGGATGDVTAGATDDAGAGGAAGEQARPEARLAHAVRVAEQALIEFEIAVETFRVEVENFSRLHHQRLGPMYARLDELDALIAEARAARSGDPEDLRKAQEARAIVMPMPGVDELFHDWIDSDGLSPEAAAMLTEQPVRPPKRVRPTDEARKLYRELARKAHPDLAQDEKERARRDEFITRVNAAYGRGDEALLRELAQEWAAGPVVPPAELSEADELYARLNWLTQRKELLTVLAQELEQSAIGAMLRMAPDDPDHLLEEIAEQLLGEVSQREAELSGLQ
ncbi:J domain-containing protein [Streptomyces sp. NBC_00385]|uniref:J domain-containing protein n=1 Tax=Streptomyces sp. NBC_00385 TaxID=2975733 RepID=UPI002DDC4570|nr:J domain-containing protein [Streptomyces sp. NBC_00385]WRZ05327.1 J domain-containing protein [Streptomyces sp. NBC_00385]